MKKKRIIITCVAATFIAASLMLLLFQSTGIKMILGLFTLNHSRIVFYGRLEDQFGRGLGNTPVNFNVRIENGFRSGVDRGTVVTDANGFFKISGRNGEILWIAPHVAGYAIASENREAIYSSLWPENERAHPDPKKPVVIKMWKLQGAEPLVGLGSNYKIHYTNQSLCFDLLAGKIVSNGGDIKITVNRPSGIISERNPQVFSVKFEAVDGGIMDSSGTERITYSAPDVGYSQSKTISSSDKLPEGSGISGFRTGFYLKSRNGKVYAKVQVSFGINESPDDLMCVEFKGLANTNSSRNWEGDSNNYKEP